RHTRFSRDWSSDVCSSDLCVLNRTVLRGGEMVLLPKFELGLALKTIQSRRITALPGVPTMYQAFLDSPKIEKFDLTSVRACISGDRKRRRVGKGCKAWRWT